MARHATRGTPATGMPGQVQSGGRTWESVARDGSAALKCVRSPKRGMGEGMRGSGAPRGEAGWLGKHVGGKSGADGANREQRCDGHVH